MNPAVTSYFRHLIVTSLVVLLSKYKFPVSGLDQFADSVALLAIGSASWLAVKYLPPSLLAKLGIVGALVLSCVLLQSCSTLPTTQSFSGFSFTSPWGSVTDQAGTVVITPAPIIIPAK